MVGFDDGTAQAGSSGSPLFDQNKKVIGQLHGGLNSCAPVTKYYGQFQHSWTGGGTNASRLSNWLDPCSSEALITNTARAPIMTGSNPVCSSGTTFTVINLPTGSTVTWNNSSNLTLSSSSGSQAVFAPIGSGEGWIQATVNSASCGSITLPRADVYVGCPEYSFRVTRPDGYPVTNDEYGNLSFCPNTNYDIMVYYGSNYCPVSDLVWTVPSTWTTNYSSGYTISINTNDDPYNNISVDSKNCCNEDINICMYFENSTTCDLYPSYSMTFAPNPSVNESILTIVPKTAKKFDETTEWDLEIYDSMRNLKSRISNLKGDSRTINTSGWNDGVYIVRARVNGEIVIGKLIVN